MVPIRSLTAASLCALIALATGCEQDVTIVRPSITDVRFQDPPTEVDILLVVDNSCSMGDEQEKLGAGFGEFVRFFEVAEVDYHIAVRTTDMFNTGPGNSGQLVETSDGVRIIDRDTEDADDVFEDLVNVGVEGSGAEMGLMAGLSALSPPLSDGANSGFLRENALLSVIFVSDENDYSRDPVDDYYKHFANLNSQFTCGANN